MGLGACAAPQRAEISGFTLAYGATCPIKKPRSQVLPFFAKYQPVDIAFSIYDGDIRTEARNADDVYADALRMFGSMVKPVVYVQVTTNGPTAIA